MKRMKIVLLLFSLCMLLSFASRSYSQDLSGATTVAEEYVFRRSWGGEGDQFYAPNDVTVGPNGKIYVANTDLHRITVIDQNQRTFQVWGGYGSQVGQFINPSGIAVDNSGNIYVADTGNYRIQKFSAEGNFLVTWGNNGTSNGQFRWPVGIEVDNQGYVYILDTVNDRIQKFTSNGVFLTVWGDLGIPYPPTRLGKIAIDTLGNVYLCNTDLARIQKYSSEGIFLLEWGESGREAGQFWSPTGIAIDSNDNVFVIDRIFVAGTHNNRIQKFTNDGIYLGTVVNSENEDVRFNNPLSLVIDNSDNIYVADTDNDRIQKFDSKGDYLIAWGKPGIELDRPKFPYGIAMTRNENLFISETGFGMFPQKFNERIHKSTNQGMFLDQWWWGHFPRGIAIDSRGNVYLAEFGIMDGFGPSSIKKYTGEGTYLLSWGEFGSAVGQFLYPNGVSLDKDDNVYVADTYNNRIQKFTSEGGFLNTWGELGSGLGQFDKPHGIAVDSIGNLYVADTNNHRVQKFTSDGEFLTAWGGLGSENGQFNLPEGITVDKNDHVYVADTNNHRIQKFDSNGLYLSSWGKRGSETGELGSPADLEVDPNGDVYITDYSNHRIHVYSVDYPLPDPISGLILNGSFDNPPYLEEWAYGGSLAVSRSTHAIHGDYSMLLGTPVSATEQGEAQVWAHQTFYIDPNWEQPLLSFRYNMFVNDIMDYSDFFVAIQDGVGLNHLATVLRGGYIPVTPGAAPAPGTDMGWRSVNYDLSAYKGQHIRLVFSNRNLWPQSWGIWTYVDDVRVLDGIGIQELFIPVLNK